jgi:ribosomal-protein-alanine N-acetyltransferase
MDVRDLGRQDDELAARLHALCFDAPWERPWSAGEFAHLLDTPGCFGLVLEEDGRPIGLALARIAADEAEIITLAVVPAARRRRGASLLLSSLIGHCRQRGARLLFLEVADDNLAARRLYEAHGFTEVGRRDAYFERGAQGPMAALILRRAMDITG